MKITEYRNKIMDIINKRGIHINVNIPKVLRVYRYLKKALGVLMKCKRPIRKIVIHCSASDFGDAKVIDEWHRMRGFKKIGYHFVILNGKRRAHEPYNANDDGKVEYGRDVCEQGAHVAGHNQDSIGICLIGNPDRIGKIEEWFTPKQIESLILLLNKLMSDFNLSTSNIFGHNDFANKICPGFHVKEFLEDYAKRFEKGGK